MLTPLLLALAAAPARGPAFAYLAPVDGVWQVWAAPAGGPPRPITNDAEEKVGLSADRDGVLLALTRSGRALFLRADGGPAGCIDLGPGAGEAAISPDGRRIAYTREEEGAATRPRRLYLADRDGAGRRALGGGGGLQHRPSWSADGAALLYTASGAAGGEDVYRTSLDGADDRQLTAGRDRWLEPSEAPDGTIVVSSDRGGDFDLWRLEPDGGHPRLLLARPGNDAAPRVSPGGDRILFVSGAYGERRVWLAGLDGDGARALSETYPDVRDPVWIAAERGTGARSGARGAVDDGAPGPAGAARDDRAAEGAEGSAALAFLRVTDGAWQPWTCRADGGGLRQVARVAVDPSRLTAAADGSLLLADGIDGSLSLISPSDGAVRRVPVEPPGSTDAALSPDGKRIVFSANTLGGVDSNDLWIVPVTGGRARKLTDDPYLQHFPSWGPDGEILYLSGRGGQTHDIWRVATAGGKPERVLGEHLYNFEPAVSSRGDVAFSSNRDGGYEIWLLEHGAAAPRRLTHDSGFAGQPVFSLDGRRLAYVSRRDGAGRIVIRDLDAGTDRPLPVEGEVRMPCWYATAARPAEGRDGRGR